MAGAIEAEHWDRLPALVEQRAAVARELPERDPDAEERQKMNALADQQAHLMEQIRRQRDALEEELAQIEKLKTARTSYEAPAPPQGVLHSKLSG